MNEPVVVGHVHLVKFKDKAIETICGVIAATNPRLGGGVKTTIWNDYDCPKCLALRPVPSRVPAGKQGWRRQKKPT
jgi:hypothetical protein